MAFWQDEKQKHNIADGSIITETLTVEISLAEYRSLIESNARHEEIIMRLEKENEALRTKL